MTPDQEPGGPAERNGPPGSARELPSEDLEELLGFIRDARGFDFTGYKRASSARRVRRRMEALGITSLPEYRDLLEVDVDEFTSLFNTILINLTSFFRDPSAWSYLADEIVPEILSRHAPDEPIRIWSAGCASGEEPYSLAIVMAERLGVSEMARRVKIFAIDIDLDALATARSGVYAEKTIVGVEQERRDRFFQPDPHGRGFVVARALRRTVVFGRHDLTRDPPISRIDLIACRNTLMYLNGETQGFVIPRLHYALNDGGYLFLGRAEMVLHGGAGRFVPASARHRVFLALPHRMAGGVAPAPPRKPFDVAPSSAPIPEPIEADFHPETVMPLSEAAFKSGRVAELLVDSTGLLTSANDAAREIFAIEHDSLGQPLSDLSVASTSLDLAAATRQAIADRSSCDLGVIQYRPAGGEVVDLEAGVLPLLDKNDRVLGASITFSDVSGTMQLRESYRQMHEELETAYEELQSTNEELVTSNEELQSSYEELETSNEELQSANEELETTNEELRSSNEELETTNLELRSTGDALVEVNATLVDANRELKRYSTLHARVMDHFPSAVVVLSDHLLVEEWNRAATDLWGLRPDEVVGEPFFGLDFGLPLQQLQEPVRECRGPSATGRTVEVPAVDRLGSPIRCRVVLVPINDGSGASAMLIMEALRGEQGEQA